MKHPGVSANGIVESVDIYPTLMQLSGIEKPNDLDGQSLLSLLDNPNAMGKEAAFGYFRNGISARSERYRLTKYFREAEPAIELYDLKNDPNEAKNIAGQNPDLVEKLMPVWEKGNTGVYGQH